MGIRLLLVAVLLTGARLGYGQGTTYVPGQVFTISPDALPPTCTVGSVVIKTSATTGIYLCAPANTWTRLALAGEGLPSGFIGLVASGSCPAGTSEVSALNDKFLRGTLAASGDVGGTGGVDAITPAGTNSAPTFTGSALGTHLHGVGTYDNAAVTAGTPAGTNQALTFTGTLSTVVVNHLHTLATGTTATGNFSQVIGTVDTSSGGTGGTPTQTALGTLSGNPTAGGAANYTPAGTINTPTFTGSALGTHDHTFSGSSEAVSAGTPAGTVTAPTFTGTSFDNKPAYVNVIFCAVD